MQTLENTQRRAHWAYCKEGDISRPRHVRLPAYGAICGPRSARRLGWALALLLAPCLCAGTDASLLDEAFGDLYNFNFPAAHQAVDRYIAEHPQESLPYSVRASGYLFYELDRLRILE